jgi:hypothetical protein
VLIRPAVAAVKAVPAVIAQTAKPLRAATALVTAANNTTGYGFGELYLNSPAYPIGTAIPAIGQKPASNAVIGKDAVIGTSASVEVKSPAVVALKGWEDAITIVKSETEIIVTAELPVANGVGLVGSTKTVIGEMTPAALQANAWVSNIVYALGTATPVAEQVATLEQYLYNHALECTHVVTNTMRNIHDFAVPCKKLVITLYPSPSYNPDSVDIQLDQVFSNPVNQGS